VLITAAFFRRLEAQDLPFLLGASGDFTTASASGEGGSLEAGVSTMGAVLVFPFGFLLSLQKEGKAKTSRNPKEKKKVKDKISSQQKLTSLKGRKVHHPHWEQKAPQ
jgi:hypothetical protein